MQPIIMHINYMEQGQSIQYLCKKAAKIGFDGIEFRRKRAAVNETPAEYLDEVKKWTSEYKIKHVLFGGPGCDFMNGKEKMKAEIDSYKEFLDLAAERELLSVLNFMTGPLFNPDPELKKGYSNNGAAIATEAQWADAAEGCQILSDYAKQYGVKFAFETHMNYIHDLVPATMKLVNMIDRDNFGVNLDYGNAIFFKERPTLRESIEMCGDKLFYTHFKNYMVPNGNPSVLVPMALSDGLINHREYLKVLNEVGYDGLIGIEAPKPGDREWYALKDYEYITWLMKDIIE